VNGQNNLEQKAGDTILPDFKTYHKAIRMLKNGWYWQENRHVRQWNRIEPERNKSMCLQSNDVQHKVPRALS
jgi:hypothetical protein